MDKRQLLDIGIKKRNKEIEQSWQELAAEHGNGQFVDGESFRLWVKNQTTKGSILSSPSTYIDETENSYKESHEIHKDGTQSSNKLVKMSLEQSKDPNYLLKTHGFSSESWELISARNNIWNAYSKKDGIMQLYSSKVTVKTKEKKLTVDDMKQLFVEMSNDYKSPAPSPTNYDYDGKLLEVNITDLHLGKLCWNGDSNDTYNHEIAKERFFKIINGVIERSNGYTFNKILFVFSHDFFHVDNSTSSTTAGTRQDMSTKWAEMFKLGVSMLVDGIDLLSQFAPVQTFYVGANHDKLMSYFAIEYLAAWFRNNPNVDVNTDPKIRHYVEYGKCLIGFAHGHSEGKRGDYVMPIEAKESWGRTIFREMHRGHIHSEKAHIVEENGIIIRHLSSPSGIDTWHYESGYIGAIKKSQNFIWDRDNGLEAILNITF